MYLVECKPDAVLVKSITFVPKRKIEHVGNKSELLKKLTVGHYNNSVGIIDEDPWSAQPPYLLRFTLRQNLTSYNFKILHYTSKNNILIVLDPRLEEWVLKSVEETNIDLKT